MTTGSTSLRVWALSALLAAAACGDRGRGRDQEQPAQGSPQAADAVRGDQGPQEIEGTLARAASHQIVIRSHDLGDVTLRVNDGTSIVVDGQPASPDRLQEGSPVRASFETGQGGRPTATRIEAQSAAAGVTESPSNRARGGTGADSSGQGLGSGDAATRSTMPDDPKPEGSPSPSPAPSQRTR